MKDSGFKDVDIGFIEYGNGGVRIRLRANIFMPGDYKWLNSKIVLIAMWHPDIVFIMEAYVFGEMAAVFFVPLYLGLFWRRPTSAAGVASMITGLSAIVIFTLYRLLILHPIILGILSSLVVYLLFTFVTPSESKRVEAFMERIGRSS